MTAPAISAPAKGRLGNGQLRRQVAEWLAARPGPLTVGEIAKDLGRSAGAVGNASLGREPACKSGAGACPCWVAHCCLEHAGQNPGSRRGPRAAARVPMAMAGRGSRL
jgi:hypothetical protein